MIDQLIERIQKTEAPIAVGLDSQLSLLPDTLKGQVFNEMGETLEAAAEAIWRFNRRIIDATEDLVPAVKVQIAMYEQYGIPGLIAFQKTVDYARAHELIVIGDVKRGDIGSTSDCYARAHLGRSMVGDREYPLFDEDFATVNPYFGTDGVLPFLKVCDDEDKGIFLLVKTSNPSSGEFQDRLVLDRAGDGPDSTFLPGSSSLSLQDFSMISKEEASSIRLRPLYEIVAEKVREWASEERLIGKYGYSEIGAVVGATYPEMGKTLRKMMPKSYILVPGYGAQGGRGKDLKSFFNKDGLGAIVNSSRGIIAAWKEERYSDVDPDHFEEASRKAVLAMIRDIRSAF